MGLGGGVKIGLIWANFASIAPFDPALLIKSRILVHFLVELICGSFWEIFSCPSHSVGELWWYKWALGLISEPRGYKWAHLAPEATYYPINRQHNDLDSSKSPKSFHK